MKTCPKCRIKVGGQMEYCPLCQNTLVGEGTTPLWPTVVPTGRRISMTFKIVAFLVLAACVICAAVDISMPGDFHWSAIVLCCSVVFLLMLRLTMQHYQSMPRLLFQILIAVSAVTLFSDAYTGWTGFSIKWVVPILCMITLTLNFILAFVKRAFAENGLVYLLLNILVGVVPYLLLLIFRSVQPLIWMICLVESVITFLGLVVFKGRDLWAELQKRFHL